MKEVTLKNVKCKTGGLIPRKGDGGYERYPNIEVTVEINNKKVKPQQSIDENLHPPNHLTSAKLQGGMVGAIDLVLDCELSDEKPIPGQI
ncbi:hypothetical protein AgCh_004683 [Apium graveolens]